MDEEARTNLAAVEEEIVNLESAPQLNAISQARRKINSLSRIPDNEFQALLAAWSGRLYLLEGSPEDAQRELRRSRTMSQGNWVSVVLASRLETNPEKRLVLIEEAIKSEIYIVRPDMQPEGPGELQIEKGRALLETGRFQEAVAAFDLAFSLLGDKPFYRNNFTASRDRAWDLRNMDPGMEAKVLELVLLDGMSWRDMIEITKTETDLLRFLTAGRDWPSDEIFRRLLERSFIPATRDIAMFEWPAGAPGPDEIVLRSGTAWFLWRLHAENRANRGLLSRYSSRYANMPNARSPINDLPLLSPFFDSILGCVESEFMNLPDGRNFFPDEKIRGAACLMMLKKIN